MVIVSEETGTVSIAENGTLARGLTPAVLKKELRVRLAVESDRSFSTAGKLLRANG